jgi:hypothetical protein
MPRVLRWLLAFFLSSVTAIFNDTSAAPVVVRMVRDMTRTLTPAQRSDPIIVAESNTRFHPITRWWMDNMRKLRLDRYLMVALDPVEYKRLQGLHPYVAFTPGMNMNYSTTAFRDPGYNKIVNYKWQIVIDLLMYGYKVLLTDVDILWRRNPLPYLSHLPYCDMYLTTNVIHIPPDMSSPLNPKPLKLTPPYNGDGVENWVNTGFCYLHPAPQVIALARKVLDEPFAGMDDQYTFNIHLERIWKEERAKSRNSHGRRSCANYGNVTFHILRPDLFQHRYIHESNPTIKNWIILHFNWLETYEQKLNIMVSQGFMDPKYLQLK